MPHQGILLWLRGLLTVGIALYNLGSYRKARKEFRRPLAFLFYMIWPIFDLSVRFILIFTPNIFGVDTWLAEHWYSLGITLGVLFQFLGSKELNKIWHA